MGRVLILAVADLRHMTCVNYYCDYLERRNIDFDIICTSRYAEKSRCMYNCNLYQFEWKQDKHVSKLKKVIPFIDFLRYAHGIINQKRYDFIIVWGENTLLLFSLLLSKFKNRYCFNMRDYFDAPLDFLNKWIKKYAVHARFSTVPSPKMLDKLDGTTLLLTNYDYLVEKKYRKSKEFHKQEGPIRITYMGLIYQYEEAFKRMLDLFRNDDRFKLAFYGSGSEEILKSYAEKNDIHNAVFGGAFTPEKTSEYLEQTDIINSVYGATNYGVSDAVGVKESYAPILHIPVISDKGCFWANLSEQYGFGKGIDLNSAYVADDLFLWYTSLKKENVDAACNNYCASTLEKNKVVERMLDDALESTLHI